MCLAVPGRIVAVAVGPDGDRSATVEYPGERRTASLLYLPEAKTGDFLLVQAGFGIRLLTEAQAAETRAAMQAAAELAEGARPGAAGALSVNGADA